MKIRLFLISKSALYTIHHHVNDINDIHYHVTIFLVGGEGVIKLLLGGAARFSYTNAHRNTLFRHNDKYERLLGHCVWPQPQEHY